MLSVTVILFTFLLWNYWKSSRPFFQRLEDIASPDSDEEAAASSIPASSEQELLVASAISNSFRKYQNQLNTLRAHQEEHQHFNERWAHYMKSSVSVVKLLVPQGKAPKQWTR